jgi:hypothetical protein
VFFELILSLTDDQQIIGDIGVLVHKTIVISVDPLLALCDMVATCSGQLVIHAISNYRITDELYLSRLAGKRPDMTLIHLSLEELDIFCIQVLRSGVGGDGVRPGIKYSARCRISRSSYSPYRVM